MAVEKMIEEALGESFNLFKKQYIALIVGTIIAAVGSIFIITAPPLFFGIYYMASKSMRGENVEIKDVFKGFDYLVRSWILSIVVFVAITIGLICFVIPGLALMVLFQYAIAVAIMENLGAIDSLKRSFNIGKENPVFSIILLILLAVINGIGSAIPVGLLITLPYTAIATCIAVQKLTSMEKEKQ